MNRKPSAAAWPPRLSMNAYADFVERPLFGARREMAERQKRLEERIATPFRFPPEPLGEKREAGV